jgi:hypothetical protein
VNHLEVRGDRKVPGGLKADAILPNGISVGFDDQREHENWRVFA